MRNESYILRTFQSIPAPISDAISFGFSTTESGPVAVRSVPTLALPDATALGVGAPTAVSATGGKAVERPNQRTTVDMIGSRNHHASASTPMIAMAQPSLSAPLRQPSMIPDLIHRAILLECALHQIHVRNCDGLGEVQTREDLLEALEVARPGLARGARERDVRAKRPRFRGKAERREG